jgi:hypothetical protein
MVWDLYRAPDQAAATATAVRREAERLESRERYRAPQGAQALLEHRMPESGFLS